MVHIMNKQFHDGFVLLKNNQGLISYRAVLAFFWVALGNIPVMQ